LATSRKINLEWHSVCNGYEHEELSRYKAMTQHEYTNPRHEIFDELKWHNHTRYQGGWGPESLYYNHESQTGIVHSTLKRAEQIRQWIQDQMFNLAPGND